MTSQTAPKKPHAPLPAAAKLKLLPFAFPFLRKGRGTSEASAQFTNEQEIHRLLAEREASGTYLASRKGMWHGGVHITEAGAGQSLDLDAGLRCIADGELVAFRANKDYPISEMGESGGDAPFQAPYSTGFALVRHSMEFPPGTKLTFYSLYMHLMSCGDYANYPKRDKPSYWTRQWKVTQYAQDKPLPDRNGRVADGQQKGLHVRKRPKVGEIVGLLPQGASVAIGKREGDWGQVTNLHGASLYPPKAGGYVEPDVAIGHWVYLGRQNGGPVLDEVIEDSMFDRVIVTTNRTSTNSDPHGDGVGIPIKAGDLIGHLGRYDSLDRCTSGTRMAHIEVFCDDPIQSFLEQGRTWLSEHGQHKDDWVELGLPSEPTMLRIEPGTVLYRQQDENFVAGSDPQSRKTDTVQVYSLAELARDPKRRVAEALPNSNAGQPVSWWHVDGVNAQGQPIEGWVRDSNFAGGRVTREFAQQWVDFECLSGAHDPSHTIFATAQKWVDYVSSADVVDVAARSKLSPLMLAVYDALFKKGDGKQAADELCALPVTERGGYPWLVQAASRLIVKHESEWANPAKWAQLIAELEKKTGARLQHEEERKRIAKLAWWDEVRAGVLGFPAPEVHHLSPIALAANFASKNLVCKHCGSTITLTHDFLKKIAPEAEADFVDAMICASVDLFPAYGVDTCRQMKHLLAQAKHETQRFSKFRESLYYRKYTGEDLYKMAKSAIDSGFDRKGMVFKTRGEKIEWIQEYLVANDSAYGEHCFGTNEQPGKDFRGRGMLHLTHYETYKRCAQAIGYPIDSQPELVEGNPVVIIETALWFWSDRKIGLIADDPATLGDDGVKRVTRPINPGYKGLSERQRFKKQISDVFEQTLSSGCNDD